MGRDEWNSRVDSLRPSACLCVLCGNSHLNAENAEIRRGPQRKTMKLIALIFITAVTVAAQDQRKQLDTLRAEGYDALYNLDYEGARKRFQKMIELAPDHPAGAQCFA